MESAHDIWQKTLGELQTQVSRANFNTWLRNSQGISFDDGVFVVGTPSAFVAEWLTRRLHSLTRKTLSHVTGTDTQIEFCVSDGSHLRQPTLSSGAVADGGVVSPASIDHNHSRCTFDNFIVGSCNRLAYATALEIAENPLSTFNPLYIYGGTGQGKTHLLQAIARSAERSGRGVRYTTAERFTDEFVMAVKQKRVEEFHARFKALSLFLFDDLQFLAGKRQTQHCFYHVFDELHQRNCLIAVAGDHHPRDIQFLSEKLRSRLESGMVACIQPPDLDSRISFLRARAADSDIEVPADAVRLLAEEVRGNMRQLEGAIVYLSAQARISGDPITAQSVHRLLTSISTSGAGKAIIHAVADLFDAPVDNLISKKRDKRTAFARHVAMYLMRKHTGSSFSEIGRELGNRNHATVLHGYNRIALELTRNPKLARQLSRISSQLPDSQDM